MRSFRSPQRGVSLIVTLVLLVFITILGLSAIRTVTQEERMSTQTYDRSLAFQATEATLRQAEGWVEAAKPMPTPGARATPCPVHPAGDGVQPPWRRHAALGGQHLSSWTDAPTVGTGDVAITPSYFVEYLGSSFPCRPGNASDPMSCKRYRVTARVVGGDTRASIMLQSVYATD
jgi:type IV pilus assembly protein PilX